MTKEIYLLGDIKIYNCRLTRTALLKVNNNINNLSNIITC